MKIWVAKLAVLFAGLIVSLVLVEFGLRIFGPDVPIASPTFLGREAIRDPLPGVPYVYPGHANYTQVWPSNPRDYFDQENNGLTYRVNNYGFRGDDFTVARNEEIRIAFVGDSLCWGIGVRESDSFASLIETALNRARPLDQSYEVLNFCLPGYATPDETALYSSVVRYFQPDLLIVWYFLNDIDNPEDRFIDRRARRLVRHRSRPEDRRVSQWHLLELVKTTFLLRNARTTLIENVNRAHRNGHPGITSVDAALTRLHHTTGTDGVSASVAILPWLFQLDGERYPFRASHKSISQRSARLEFDVLDLFPTFDGSRASRLWVHPTDHHPNEVGHRMIASATSDYLIRQLEELGDEIVSRADARRRTEPPTAIEDEPQREWYEAFHRLTDDDRSGSSRNETTHTR